jgi:hypothetical protein
MKEQIEGSAARAADRGRDQLFEGALSDKGLNSLSAVDAVIRSFAGKVTQVRADYNADKITDAQAREEVASLAQEYADVFMGKSSDYVAQPWNTPEQLGAYLVAVMDGKAEPETAARDFLLYIAAQLLQVMVEHESGKLDDDVAQFRVDALLEDADYALLGIPQQEMPESDS